jgi:uncharacterized protein
MANTDETSSGLSSLANERYLSITTLRSNSSPASTPVWVVSDDPHRLPIATGADSWKVRRITRDPHVRVAGCSARGKEHGEPVAGIAHLVDEEALVRHLQREKYGWQMRVVEGANAFLRRVLRRPGGRAAFIEVVPDETAGRR